jgi:hypothetical protein
MTHRGKARLERASALARSDAQPWLSPAPTDLADADFKAEKSCFRHAELRCWAFGHMRAIKRVRIDLMEVTASS